MNQNSLFQTLTYDSGQVSRVERLLQHRGPEAIHKLGFERQLEGSNLEKWVLAGAGAYGFKLMNDFPIQERLYEGANALKHYMNRDGLDSVVGKIMSMDRRRFLALASMAGMATMLPGCGSSPTSPTPIDPCEPNCDNGGGGGNTSTATVTVNVNTKDGHAVGGVVEYLDSSGNVLGGSRLDNGSKTFDVENSDQIARVRITKSGTPNSSAAQTTEAASTTRKYLSAEYNEAPIADGASVNRSYKVLDEKLGLEPIGGSPRVPNHTFWDWVNRDAAVVNADDGVKLVTEPLTIYADMSTNPGINPTTGEQMQTPDERVRISQQAVNAVYSDITGFGAPQIIKRRNPPSPGNGNIVFVYDEGLFGQPFIDGVRITGGKVAVSPISLEGDRDIVDRVELATVLYFLGESDLVKPSMANNNQGNNPIGGQIHEVDRNMLEASKADFISLGNVWKDIDPYIFCSEPEV